MSIREHAKSEMQLAGVEPDCQLAILGALDLVLDAFDSGGAAAVGFDLFTRLWAGKPLTPLTGEDQEWIEHPDCYQNRRCGSIFKVKADNPRYGLKIGDCYDLDNYELVPGKINIISFPYWPPKAEIDMPVYYKIEEKDDGPTAAK